MIFFATVANDILLKAGTKKKVLNWNVCILVKEPSKNVAVLHLLG